MAGPPAARDKPAPAPRVRPLRVRGPLTCVRNIDPSSELCGTGINGNGQTDEPGCIDCSPGNSVTATAQTGRTSVKLSLEPGRDSVRTQGRFRLPAGVVLAPDTEPVMLQLTDGTGATYYDGTIPAGSFIASSSRRSFKFNDSTLASAGIRTAKLTVASDGVTVKYSFKMKGLDDPPFFAGTGTAFVKVGSRCFVDTADSCTVAASGAAASCQ